MTLRFLGGDTGGGGSPRLYREGDDYLVQGYAVTEPQLLAELNVPAGETVVRVPRSLWAYLPTGLCMKQRSAGSNRQMLAGCGHDACRLEVRDWYAAEEGNGEDGRLPTWQAGTFDLARDTAARRCWLDLMKTAAGQDAATRAARTGAEPGNELMRFEGFGAPPSIEAAEQVRWLLRRRASALPSQGKDLKVTGGPGQFLTGDGRRARSEMASAAALARECMSAFDAVWAISATHGGYGPA